MAMVFGEPELKLVEPGRVGRRVVHLHLRMRGQKLLDKFGFMSREVISNDMNLAPPRLTGHDVSEKGDELLTGVPRSRAADDFPCFGVQRGVQREGAVTVVLESMSLRSTRRQRQYRIQSVQRLH